MPFTVIRVFSRQLGNIIDDKCAWCGEPIRATDFIDDEDRSFYFSTGYCPMCQAKWRADIGAVETRLGLDPYWSGVSFSKRSVSDVP